VGDLGRAHRAAFSGVDVRKMFFFEKKNQKTFARLERDVAGSANQRIKVFWFFFSKKNML
jgi:hypothetical protein